MRDPGWRTHQHDAALSKVFEQPVGNRTVGFASDVSLANAALGQVECQGDQIRCFAWLDRDKGPDGG